MLTPRPGLLLLFLPDGPFLCQAFALEQASVWEHPLDPRGSLLPRSLVVLFAKPPPPS